MARFAGKAESSYLGPRTRISSARILRFCDFPLTKCAYTALSRLRQRVNASAPGTRTLLARTQVDREVRLPQAVEQAANSSGHRTSAIGDGCVACCCAFPAKSTRRFKLCRISVPLPAVQRPAASPFRCARLCPLLAGPATSVEIGPLQDLRRALGMGRPSLFRTLFPRLRQSFRL